MCIVHVHVWSDLEDTGKGNELTASIFKILYATADGFQPADEEEEEEIDAGQEQQQQPEQSASNSSVEPEEEAQEETF